MSDGEITPASLPHGEMDNGALPPHVVAALEDLRRATDVLTALDLLTVDGSGAAAVAAELATVTSRLSVARVRLLPVIDADGLWARVDGARSFPVWVAAAHRVPIAAARAQVRLGRALRDHLPVTAAAAAAGVVSVEHAQVLATHTTTSAQRRQVLADAGHECNEAVPRRPGPPPARGRVAGAGAALGRRRGPRRRRPRLRRGHRP